MSARDLDVVIDDVLDEVASPEDRTWLEQRIASDPVVRERWSERKALFASLDGGPLADPPSALLPAVLREITGVQRPVRVSKSWLDTLADTLRLKPTQLLVYGSALAVGLAVLTLAVARPTRSPSPHAAGTMAPLATAPATVVRAGDAQARISIARDGAAIVAEIEVQSPGPGELTLACSAGVSAAEAFWARGGGSPPELGPGHVRASFPGTGTLRVRFETLGPSGPLATATLHRGSVESQARVMIPREISAVGP
jgi:hypothetical protein